MKRKKIIAISITVLIVISLIFSGCTKSNNTEGQSATPEVKQSLAPVESVKPVTSATPEPEEKHDPVTIKVLSWATVSQIEIDFFHKKYPWITVEPIITDNVVETAIAMQAAGTPADLSGLNSLDAWVAGDMLEDLTPYIAKDATIQNSKIQDGFLELFKTGNQILAIPNSDIPVFMVVNKDLLKKHGMEMPANDWTYDQFLDMAKKATDSAAGEFGFTLGFGEPDFANIVTLANGSAGNLRFMNKEYTQIMAQTPELQADLKWIQELTTKWHVKPTSEQAEAAAFLTGKTLFTMGADWEVSGYKENAKFEWDVLPMPKGKATNATLHYAGMTGLLKSSKNKEAAFKWISYQFELERQKRFIETGSSAFVIHPELESYIKEVDIWKGKNTDAIIQSGKTCCYLLESPRTDFYYPVFMPALNEVLYKGADPNTLTAVAEQYNKIMKEVVKK